MQDYRRAHLKNPKCTKTLGGRGFAPDPTGGAYSAPTDPLAGGEGLTPPLQESHALPSPSGFDIRPFGPRLAPAMLISFRRH